LFECGTLLGLTGILYMVAPPPDEDMATLATVDPSGAG
jgi:hypothetical protein